MCGLHVDILTRAGGDHNHLDGRHQRCRGKTTGTAKPGEINPRSGFGFDHSQLNLHPCSDQTLTWFTDLTENEPHFGPRFRFRPGIYLANLRGTRSMCGCCAPVFDGGELPVGTWRGVSAVSCRSY